MLYTKLCPDEWSFLLTFYTISDCPRKETAITDNRVCLQNCTLLGNECNATEKCVCDGVCGMTCVQVGKWNKWKEKGRKKIKCVIQAVPFCSIPVSSIPRHKLTQSKAHRTCCQNLLISEPHSLKSINIVFSREIKAPVGAMCLWWCVWHDLCTSG